MARQARPPVIAVMGHIDHGKSSLLDYIRKASVVASEAGGITQHVAAYVALHEGRRVTFLDTPGHEAFTALRARGAQAADIAILVVAADEGVMPQTLDALAAIREARIPFVVAFSKIDKANADLERAKASLLEHGIYLEGQGGDVPYAALSSKSGEGVSALLDLVLLAADLAGITADPEASAEGFVLEATNDPKRGASATLIVKEGTLTKGVFVVAGDAYAPVRFIENFRGERVESAGPAEPVRISGFSKLPAAGMLFTIAKSKKTAEAAAAKAAAAKTSVPAAAADGLAKLPLVVKADVQGSVDAILHELAKLSHERVALAVLSAGVGAVSESDVKAAAAAGGVILAFNVETDAQARELALRDQVPVETFSLIYELTKRAADLLPKRAPHITEEKELGRARVVKTFSSGAKKQVLGLRHESGAFALGDRVRILRGDALLAEGALTNLQVARANVKEVKDGEFGAEVSAKEDAAPGDTLTAYRVVES